MKNLLILFELLSSLPLFIALDQQSKSIHSEEKSCVNSGPMLNRIINDVCDTELFKDERKENFMSDLKYNLFTKKNKIAPKKIYQKRNIRKQLIKSNFDPTKEILILIHGMLVFGITPFDKFTKDEALRHHDINVFVTSWGRVAGKFYPWRAVNPIGELIGDFIRTIQKKFKVPGSNITLVGYSLGTHVAGCAGAVLKDKVKQIIGLDPPCPCFNLNDTSNRLDKSDAKYVQIIHTNGDFFAFHAPIGHVDYYPNGGLWQPNCAYWRKGKYGKTSKRRRKSSWITDVMDFGGHVCSHARAYQYFGEALRRGPVFKGVACDSYENYKNNKCEGNRVSYMGLLSVDHKSLGKYYMDTNSREPWGKDTNESYR